jgi:hypothetical protein
MATDWSKYKPSQTDWSKYKTGTTTQSEQKSDFFGGVGTFLKGLTMLPKTIAASVLQATQGKKGASVTERDWADRFISNVGSDIDRFVQETAGKYGEAKPLPGMPFKITDIAQLPQSLAYSITSMGAGAAAAIPTALTGIGLLVAGGAGGLASGATAYSMTTYQITQQYLEAKDAEKRAKTGKGLTQQEEDALKSDFSSKATQYGLWEAVPEGLSNVVFAGAWSKPFIAALQKTAGKSIAGKVAGAVLKTYASELATETVTQKGQAGIEVEAGLREGKITWTEAFKEVFPQTFLLTTLMAGAGSATIPIAKARAKIQASLTAEAERKKIPTTSEIYQETSKAIDEGIKQAQEAPVEQEQPKLNIAKPRTYKGVEYTRISNNASEVDIVVDQDKVGWFTNLFTKETENSKGSATSLVSDGIKELNKKGVTEIRAIPENKISERLFTNLGFKQNGREFILKQDQAVKTAPDAQAPQMAISKAGADLLRTAMKEKIVQKGNIPTHERTNLAQRYDKAVQFTSQNFQQAQEIALGRAEAPAGYFKSDIYEAVEAQALLTNNVDLIEQLKDSTVPTQAGQELVGFKGTDELNPIDRIKEVRAVLKQVKADTKKKELLTEVKGETKKKNLTKAELETKLSKFIDDNIC